MLSYITIGANDIQRAERFYSSIFCPLGYERKEEHDAVACCGQSTCGCLPMRPEEVRTSQAGRTTAIEPKASALP
jgi:catechol 2,3-dioxygenase-like lactoylglutathione lyase family enzyme